MADPRHAIVDLLWPLGACIFFSATAATTRLELESRAERIVATALLSNAFAVVPIYLLGLAGALTRATLGGVIVGSTVAIAAATYKRDKAIVATMKELALAPFEVFREALRANAPVAFVALGATGYILFAVYASYLAPTWRSYDALWYHEPIVGFAIQNKGFAWVDVPPELDVVNANPRASEMLQLFFAIVGGRRVIETASVVTMAAVGVAHHALFGRLTSRVDVRLGFSAALLLVPAFFIQIGTTYIDAHVWGLLVVGLFFATARAVSRGYLALTALAVGLAFGAKATAYLPGGVVLLVAMGRHVEPRRLFASGARAILVGSLALPLAIHTFVRNAVHFKNPVYPVPVALPSLGIAWQGLGAPFEDAEVIEPFLSVWKNAAGQPGGDGKYSYPFYVLPHTAREAAASFNYGYAVAYVLVPFGAVALLFMTARVLASPAVGLPRRHATRVVMATTLALAGIVHYATLKYLHLARYHGVLLTMLVVAIVAASEVLRRPTWAGALAAAACGLGVVSLAIQDPRVYLVPGDVAEMREVPYPEREATPRFGAPTTLDGGRLRAGFAPGSVIAYSENLQAIAPLWNDDYSNRVVYVHGDKRLSGELDAAGARYYVCTGYCTAHPELFHNFAPRGPMFTFSTSAILYERRAP